MDCLYCNKKADNEWNYCAYCGHKIEKHNMFISLINKHLKHIGRRFPSQEHRKGIADQIHGITISITAGHGAPKVSVTPGIQELQHHQSKQTKKVERKQPKKIVEPDVLIKKTGNAIFADINLPEVKSEDDIDIEIFPNSIELKAYAEDKGYFKIINIPQHFGLVEKKLENEKLRLIFSA